MVPLGVILICTSYYGTGKGPFAFLSGELSVHVLCSFFYWDMYLFLDFELFLH